MLMHHGAPSKIEPPLATYVAKKTVASLLWQDYGYTALLGGLFFIFSESNRIIHFHSRISRTSGSYHQYHPPDTTDIHKADSTVVDPD